MSFLSFLFRDGKPHEVPADYWKQRWDESLKGKTIVTRYFVTFGTSAYDGFCGIKEVKGYYGLTYADPPNTHPDGRWKDDTEKFFQIDRDDSHSKYLLDPKFCFETQEQAQDAYNENVHLWVAPLQARIEALMAAMTVGRM